MATFSRTTRKYAFLCGAAALCLTAFAAGANAEEQAAPAGGTGPGFLSTNIPAAPVAAPGDSSAEAAVVDVDLPPIPAEPTHPMLRLTPDKSEIVNLDKPVKTVVVGNENNMQVFLDSSRRLVLVPRLPGATYFTALDEGGNVVMQRHVIVASPKDKYVRIRRTCAMSTGNCASIQTYYCPDMCHEIAATGAPTAGSLSSVFSTLFSGATPGAAPAVSGSGKTAGPSSGSSSASGSGSSSGGGSGSTESKEQSSE